MYKKVITKKFAYNDKATKIALKNTYIELPVTTTGKIDYQYMEERIRELSAYLTVSGLNNYSITDTEKKIILQTPHTEKICLEKLFSCSTGDVDLQQSKRQILRLG